MSHHLSEDQFTKCAVGGGGKAETEHLRNCPECSAEMDRFGKTMSAFRSAVRNRIESHVPRRFVEPFAPSIPIWRWAAVVALFIVVVSIPFFISTPKPQESEIDPNTLMREVNLHLSRTVPAPMEPMLVLIPDNEPEIESGGVQ